MSPAAFAITIGAIEGLLFFMGLSWVLTGGTFAWQESLPLILGVALPVGAFVGWRSFKSVLALMGPGPSFLRTIGVGLVSGGVIGVAFILVMPLLATHDGPALSTLLRAAIPGWLAIGMVLGLLHATLTWLFNACMIKAASPWIALASSDGEVRVDAPQHKFAVAFASLLIAGLLITTLVQQGWNEPERPELDFMPEVTVTTNAQGLQGAAHRDGREVIPHRFAYVGQISPRFFEVRAVAQPGDKTPKFGIWSVEGQQVIEPKYRDIRHVALHQRFRVSLGDESPKFGYFDEDGREILPVVYDHLERITNLKGEPTNVARQGDGYGYVDIRTGEVLIEPVYETFNVSEDMIDASGHGILLARRQGKWGVINTRGRPLTDFSFDELEVVDHETLRGKRLGQEQTIKFPAGAIQP